MVGSAVGKGANIKSSKQHGNIQTQNSYGIQTKPFMDMIILFVVAIGVCWIMADIAEIRPKK